MKGNTGSTQLKNILLLSLLVLVAKYFENFSLKRGYITEEKYADHKSEPHTFSTSYVVFLDREKEKEKSTSRVSPQCTKFLDTNFYTPLHANICIKKGKNIHLNYIHSITLPSPKKKENAPREKRDLHKQPVSSHCNTSPSHRKNDDHGVRNGNASCGDSRGDIGIERNSPVSDGAIQAKVYTFFFNLTKGIQQIKHLLATTVMKHFVFEREALEGNLFFQKNENTKMIHTVISRGKFHKLFYHNSYGIFQKNLTSSNEGEFNNPLFTSFTTYPTTVMNMSSYEHIYPEINNIKMKFKNFDIHKKRNIFSNIFMYKMDIHSAHILEKKKKKNYLYKTGNMNDIFATSSIEIDPNDERRKRKGEEINYKVCTSNKRKAIAEYERGCRMLSDKELLNEDEDDNKKDNDKKGNKNTKLTNGYTIIDNENGKRKKTRECRMLGDYDPIPNDDPYDDKNGKYDDKNSKDDNKPKNDEQKVGKGSGDMNKKECRLLADLIEMDDIGNGDENNNNEGRNDDPIWNKGNNGRNGRSLSETDTEPCDMDICDSDTELDEVELGNDINNGNGNGNGRNYRRRGRLLAEPEVTMETYGNQGNGNNSRDGNDSDENRDEGKKGRRLRWLSEMEDEGDGVGGGNGGNSGNNIDNSKNGDGNGDGNGDEGKKGRRLRWLSEMEDEGDGVGGGNGGDPGNN
ncbi:hypothetical protein POVCU1_003360, partial [Plasmodium ovale curtisi]